MAITDEDLENRFTYHAPSPIKRDKHREIRDGCLNLAEFLNEVIKEDSRELSLAITKLEEVMFWANAAIARH